MKNTVELAAEFINRAAFVDANALSKASIKSREEFRKWSDDYILGFFEGVTARHLYAHPRTT